MSNDTLTPNTTPLRVLIVEDVPTDAELMVVQLQENGWQVDWQRVQGEADYVAALASRPDLILSDWNLAQFIGERALALLRESGLDIPFIIVSGTIGEETAIDAIHQGASDHVLKNHLSRLASAVRRALENTRLRDQRKRAEEETQAQICEVALINAQLLEANATLEQTQNQLIQSEKMASIGQLAAGVAHEINNPVGYVYSNLGTLEKYLADIFAMLEKYEEAEALMNCHGQAVEEIQRFRKQIDLAYLKDDIKSLLDESREGLTRVKKIILDLKDFSHSGADEEWKWADLQQGLESTLNIVWNELKYKREVVREFGKLPPVYCLPSQINQVFMNLLVNAAQAIEEHGTVTLRSGVDGEEVWVEVADTGKGIPPEHLNRVFDPFFTTKPVGKGTGLGLSLSYNIVAKHHGSIEVHSEPGKGSTFRVRLPVQQPEMAEQA